MSKRIDTESDDYTEARARLLEAEIELKSRVRELANLRAELPEGPVVEDYALTEGSSPLADGDDVSTEPVLLSQLFDDEAKPLVLIHFMYGGAQKNPCPMCSMWADGYNAVARHVRQRASFALVAEAPIADLRAWARRRGWTDLRLLSSAGTSLKTDLKMQDADGAQHPGVSVFVRDGERVRHTYTAEAVMAPEHWNGVDLLSPVWNLFDLTPDGRGDWFPSLSYD